MVKKDSVFDRFDLFDLFSFLTSLGSLPSLPSFHSLTFLTGEAGHPPYFFSATSLFVFQFCQDDNWVCVVSSRSTMGTSSGPLSLASGLHNRWGADVQHGGGAGNPGQKPKTGWAPKPPMGADPKTCDSDIGTRWPEFWAILGGVLLKLVKWRKPRSDKRRWGHVGLILGQMYPYAIRKPCSDPNSFQRKRSRNSTEQSHHNTTVALQSSKNQADYKSEKKKNQILKRFLKNKKL